MTRTPGGHPEPPPVPEPEPPQPIPPTGPSPVPEPPHTAQPATATRNTVDLRDSGARAASLGTVSPGTASLSTASIDTAFIDAGPVTAAIEWPPVGAYPGEPGHPIPAAQDRTTEGPADGDPATVLIPAVPDTWHQPPPSEPFHARHEKPGEWRFAPPEHLAFEHSPPAEVPQHPAEPVWSGGTPHPPPWQVPLSPRRPKRRATLWVSLALSATLLLCAGGGVSAYLLLRDADVTGAPDPSTAVNRFMTAVYTRQDAGAADDLVCREARDSGQLAARVNQIKGYSGEYESPVFRWNEPALASGDDDRATLTVQLTMSTDDEKAAEQQLTFVAVRKSGWLVCDISG